MPTPTREQFTDPEFQAALADIFYADSVIGMFTSESICTHLRKRPKFRRTREVHARRARKLRKRGEDVRFLRWEHGHCIYVWSGPAPDSIVFRMMPRRTGTELPPTLQFSYKSEWLLP